MTGRPWQERVKIDLDRAKARVRQLSDRLEAQDAIVNEMRGQLIAVHARERLRRIEYFHEYIGTDQVIDSDGRIDWRRFDLLVSDLLQRRPELAAQLGSTDLIG